ncbi:MAG: LptF/LptG family permease, partial [Chlamydiales bacterium]
LEFPEMHIDSNLLEKAVIASDQLSITALLKTIPSHPFGLAMRNDEARAIASLCHKLTAPLALILAVLAPIPFCLNFSRKKRLFFTYAFALAGMVLYFVCINTTVIIGKGHMLPPFWIVTLPPLIALTFFGMRYARL